MHGESCAAPITTTSADVANFVRCPYGARQGARATTRAPCEKGWMAASTMGTKTMSEYEFTLTFSLPGEDDNPEQYLDALYESGCDDAVLGTGQPGTIGLDFVREAESAEDAVRSAIANVEAAIPGAELVEAKPDLVGLTDVADIAQCSRQYVRKVTMTIKRFPRPAVTGRKVQLWHLCDVAQFEQVKIPKAVAEIAWIARRINFDRERRQLENEDRARA